MFTFFDTVTRHKTLFIVALAIALVYGSSHFFISKILEGQGKTYYPVTLEAVWDEAITYGPRANAVRNGQIVAGDISLVEHKDTPAALPILGPFTMATISAMVGSLPNAFIVSDFVFPAFIFIALYFLFFELSRKKTFSLTCATIFIFAPKVGLYVPPVSFDTVRFFFEDLFFVFNNPNPNGLYFSRFEYPQMTYFFYALTFYFILRSLKRDEKKAVILGGIFFGATFYLYFFDWAYIAVALGVMVFLFLLVRDYERVKKTVLIFGLGLIVSIPYWINFFAMSALPQYGDIVARLGAEVSHAFRFDTWTTYLRSVVFAGALWIIFKNRDRASAVYLISFLFSVIILLNAQVILGFNPQPDHWHREQFLVIFMSVVMFCLHVYNRYCSSFFARYHSTVGFLFIFILIALQAHSQYVFSSRYAYAFTTDPALEASYSWLNEHTEKESVVGSISWITNSELLLRTHNKVYMPFGLNTLAPTDELWNRFFDMSVLYGASLNIFSGMLTPGHEMINYLFHNQYKNDNSLGSFFRSTTRHEIPREVFEKRIKEYHGRILRKSITPSYTLHYLYFGPNEIKALGEDPRNAMPSLEIVYEEKGVRIYKLNKSQ